MMLLRSLLFNVLLPVETMFSHLFGFRNEAVERSFIDLNNRLVMRKIRKTPERILLLMPHCLQFSDCEYRVTGREIRCRLCGKCEIKDLMEISRRFGVQLSVATGGTMARNIIRRLSPDLIIATACERDLISGLRDTTSLPVIGILNERPNGPCVDTRVNIDEITKYIQMFKGERDEAKRD